LRREAERIALVPGFERLITLDANAIKALPHQIDVAQRVLRHMSGRAILADEVGLGKTIKASIIYKELAIRGLARRVLILTPAGTARHLAGVPQGASRGRRPPHAQGPRRPAGADARGDDPHAAHERDRRPELAAAPRAPPRGPPDQGRGGPVPGHHRVPAPALSGRLRPAGRGGGGG